MNEITSTTDRTVCISISITEKAARWLREVLRNPLCNENETENENDKEMRKKFFDTIHSALAE